MPHPAGGAAPLPWRRWLALLVLSAAFAGLLELAGLPAALLLGPMLVGIIVSTTGRPLRVPNLPFTAAQALIGCLIAASITPGILATVAAEWPLFVGVTASTILVSALIGYALARWQVLPGTVAVWGSSPGAASAMVIMAQAYGADARLVAVMTYTRVVAVSVVASVLSLLFAGPSSAPSPGPSALFPIDPAHLAGVLAVAAAGVVLGRLARLPAGGLVGPMLVGAGLNVAGVFDPHPPQVLLGLAYAVVGWRIGLNFTRETVAAAAKALPRILLAMLLLIAFCGGLALLLVRFGGIEPVTAYLATSPGGMDSVAIIAANSNVDRPFVMALQALRFFAVLAGGPALARFVAKRHLAREKRRETVSPPPP
ncbi:AbrB family transcriptional regulator [Aureimonas leprariae]|uniref:AbrB family transcriptional regulator n=1 Tax=Plantimonas leprariae TaxID=2615207 RepID=A0A7V7PSV6_9HYPH|nr:AbrB family transcriptional regulator [Aureimonas leprariae]KAB0682661.1 AbrB family transcriptional regulator [Aureimonas leprariae]